MTAALLLADEPTGIDGIAETGRIGAERIAGGAWDNPRCGI